MTLACVALLWAITIVMYSLRAEKKKTDHSAKPVRLISMYFVQKNICTISSSSSSCQCYHAFPFSIWWWTTAGCYLGNNGSPNAMKTCSGKEQVSSGLTSKMFTSDVKSDQKQSWSNAHRTSEACLSKSLMGTTECTPARLKFLEAEQLSVGQCISPPVEVNPSFDRTWTPKEPLDWIRN